MVSGNLPPAAIHNRSDDFQQTQPLNPQQNCWHIEINPQSDRLLDLVYYQEKSVKEVAEVIQIPKSTVKTRMFYARKRLAQLLSAHRDFDHLTASRAA